MSYIGKKPVDFNDVTEAQTFNVTDGLNVSGNILLQSEGDELQFNTSSSPVNKIFSDDTYTTNGLTISADNGVALKSANNHLLIDDTGTNEMVFNVNSGERMRIASSGKVGIGTTFGENTASSANKLAVRSDTGSTHYNIMNVWEHENTSSGIEQRIGWAFGDDGGGESSFGIAGYIGMNKADAWNVDSTRDSEMTFATAVNGVVAERMRIASGANVLGVGTTNPTGNMAGVKGVATSDTSSGYGFESTSAGQAWLMWCNGSDEVEWYDVTGARPELQLTKDGALNNRTGSIGTISDERLKQDITPASSQWDDIKAVQIKNYRLIEDVEADGENAPRLLGVIAQELEASGMGGLVEEVGYTRPDENGDITTSTIKRKSVKQSILYMKAVKALQEAMERIETLETQNASLEARIVALENA